MNAVDWFRPIEIVMIKDNLNANWFYLDRFKLDRLKTNASVNGVLDHSFAVYCPVAG